MQTIPLTLGQVAFVDDDDFEAVSRFKWRAIKRKRQFYAGRKIPKAFGIASGHFQFLHQFLMPGVAQIDHRDGNGLNNQRRNLRAATTQQNQRGFRRKAFSTTSRFRGVSWHTRDKKWQAQIGVNGKSLFLGHFDSETDAALAYDVAARRYFKDFASPNFK